MNSITTYLFEYKHQTREIKWFKNALSLFLIYKVCVYVYLFPELFSSNKFILSYSSHINVLIDSAFFLTNHYSQTLVVIAIISIFILSVSQILNTSNYISRFLLWLLMVNMTNFLYPTLTAGDFLLNQLLLFNIFLTTKNQFNVYINDLGKAIHNIALIGIKVQICLVYLLSATFKITDISWLNGSAIHTIFQIPEYSNQLFSNLPIWFSKLSTYLVLVYQLSFSVFVWFDKFKKYIFGFGILQHLIISLVMGLFSFGIIMIICYILFLKYDYKSTLNNA